MRKLATLTKMTAKGLSTWTFAQCDGVYIAYGGTTNRCRVFRSYAQLQDCMVNYASYGYDLERHTASAVGTNQLLNLSSELLLSSRNFLWMKTLRLHVLQRTLW